VRKKHGITVPNDGPEEAATFSTPKKTYKKRKGKNKKGPTQKKQKTRKIRGNNKLESRTIK